MHSFSLKKKMLKSTQNHIFILRIVRKNSDWFFFFFVVLFSRWFLCHPLSFGTADALLLLSAVSGEMPSQSLHSMLQLHRNGGGLSSSSAVPKIHRADSWPPRWILSSTCILSHSRFSVSKCLFPLERGTRALNTRFEPLKWVRRRGKKYFKWPQQTCFSCPWGKHPVCASLRWQCLCLGCAGVQAHRCRGSRSSALGCWDANISLKWAKRGVVWGCSLEGLWCIVQRRFSFCTGLLISGGGIGRVSNYPFY